MKGVFIDTETGGLDSNVHALTQVAAIAFEVKPGEEAEILEVFQIFVEPSKWLAVCPGALDLQQAKLETLLKVGKKEATVYTELVQFLNNYIGPSAEWGGHIWAQDAAFDHSFLRALEKRVGNGSNCFTDRCDWNCTKRLWTLLRFLGVHNEAKTSLKNIASYYQMDEQVHDATEDALLSLGALSFMLTDLAKCLQR